MICKSSRGFFRKLLNGHSTASNVEGSPEFTSKFCGLCGAATVQSCQACNAPVRGSYEHARAVVIGESWKPSSYCYDCGEPYPWTKSALEAASEIIDEAEGLTLDERTKFKQTLPDLTKDTARNELALSRYQRLSSLIGGSLKGALDKSVSTIATEVVKRTLGF